MRWVFHFQHTVINPMAYDFLLNVLVLREAFITKLELASIKLYEYYCGHKTVKQIFIIYAYQRVLYSRKLNFIGNCDLLSLSN